MRELRRLIKEDIVEEIERILNSNKLLQNTFNIIPLFLTGTTITSICSSRKE